MTPAAYAHKTANREVYVVRTPFGFELVYASWDAAWKTYAEYVAEFTAEGRTLRVNGNICEYLQTMANGKRQRRTFGVFAHDVR